MQANRNHMAFLQHSPPCCRNRIAREEYPERHTAGYHAMPAALLQVTKLAQKTRDQQS